MLKIFVIAPNTIKVQESPFLVQLSPDINIGNHISQMQNYSELRAHYWVWKNEPSQTDKVGFFQFRRYLDLSTKKQNKPYSIRKFPEISGFLPETTEDWDVIAPTPEYTGMSVRERYKKYHRLSDLLLIEEIVKHQYPAYAASTDQYLNGKSEYYGNLYIMRRDLFDSYCEWLFQILKEYEFRAEDIPFRTQGYLAERMFGIWFTKVKEDGILKWKEVPRVHFWGYDDDKHHLRRDKLVNLIIPPGSERRALVKKLFI